MKKIDSTALALFVIMCAASSVFAETDYTCLRIKMVEEQLIPRGIEDKRVLEVMSLVERDKFVPEEAKGLVYEDVAIAMGDGKTISPPYSAAVTAQVLQLKGTEKILEVGADCGYQTAILAELSKEVYAIQVSDELTIETRERFRALGYGNISIKTGKADEGWQELAPFDDIVVNGPIAYIPQKLIDQLNNGGKLLISIGDENLNKMLLIQKQANSRLKKYDIKGTLIGPIIGEKPNQNSSVDKNTFNDNKKWKAKEGSRWKTKH